MTEDYETDLHDSDASMTNHNSSSEESISEYNEECVYHKNIPNPLPNAQNSTDVIANDMNILSNFSHNDGTY